MENSKKKNKTIFSESEELLEELIIKLYDKIMENNNATTNAIKYISPSLVSHILFFKTNNYIGTSVKNI